MRLSPSVDMEGVAGVGHPAQVSQAPTGDTLFRRFVALARLAAAATA